MEFGPSAECAGSERSWNGLARLLPRGRVRTGERSGTELREGDRSGFIRQTSMDRGLRGRSVFQLGG